MEGTTSVVMAAHEAEAHVAEAIESVLRDPAIRRRELELCVVDDGSTDSTADIVAGFGSEVTLIEQRNLGPALARNTGVANTGGEFIAFLDADDLWIEGRAETQIAALRAAGPRSGICFGRELRFGLETSESKASTSNTALVRRMAWERVGTFSGEWRVGEFLDWLARARDAGVGEVLVDAPVVRRRVHAANLTAGNPAALQDYVQILQHSLERRRKKEGN